MTRRDSAMTKREGAMALRLFENAVDSPVQTISGEVWDEIEAVITPYGKLYKSPSSEADFSIKIPSRKSLNRQTLDARRSLFSGKRQADDSLEVESPATKKLRNSSVLPDSNDIIEAVERLESRELVADGTRCYTLPTIPGKHSDLKSISPETMADIVEGHYTEQLGKVTIVDCRYPYEFEGGHIRGAVNLYTKDAVNTLLQEKSEQPRVLIFHCEFSSERGPEMYRFLRSQDRELNKHRYPHLNFPEIYLPDGGYKAFFSTHNDLCDPISYKPMLHEDHAADLRHFRVKSKSWTAGEKQKTSRRQRSRLACLNIDF
ncbi:M-phase inducer phosphatase-like [Mercenaria mercenaria]|uniref:M-phase inducer phosphatase-like n=1 Tax=Mercenaria mercenaria TaxID=6596 RepID=UPI00234F4C18|nr:M-phase inducer phosphatase-like [Mercenaria mercenaria]